ncbi:MAG TPA: thioredoxin fold domain-containing protein [Burkholderiales bacterium]|nr:thioredoxin fold domain-containing protein [Burkholderiales bacterium]
MRLAWLAFLCVPLIALAGVTEHAPKGTFSDTFLIVPEDVRDAARANKRVIVFFEQEGCPACLKMARTTFADRSVSDVLRRRFVMVALDIHGARETTWLDGKPRPEKDLARYLGIQATPTVLVLDEHGKVVERFVGYRNPRAFGAILQAASPR